MVLNLRHNYWFSDYVAYRNGRNGSIYIMILSELLCREGFTTKLTEILSKVTDMTSKALADVCQVPCFTSTLTKALLFTPKKKVGDFPDNQTETQTDRNTDRQTDSPVTPHDIK